MNPIATYKFDRPLHNEDAPAIATDRFLIVCDGLGAGGQNKHTINGETHTSAYYGSRLLSEICKEFYDKNYSVIMKSVSDKEALNRIVEELKTTIKNRLNQFVEENRLTKTIKGKSIKLLPSTLSSILYKVNDSSIDVVVISAGDTRAFSLSPQYGLQQLSKDDVDETKEQHFEDKYEVDKTSLKRVQKGNANEIEATILGSPVCPIKKVSVNP